MQRKQRRSKKSGLRKKSEKEKKSDKHNFSFFIAVFTLFFLPFSLFWLLKVKKNSCGRLIPFCLESPIIVLIVIQIIKTPLEAILDYKT